MRACELRRSVGASPLPILRALTVPGELAPLQLPPPWSFHLTTAADRSQPDTVQVAGGFRIVFRGLMDEPTVTCMFADQGIMVGEATMGLHPSLFSPSREVKEGNGWFAVDDVDPPARLLVDHSGEGVRFILAMGSAATAPSAIEEVADGFDPGAAFDEQVALARSLIGETPSFRDESDVLHTAAQILLFHLRRRPDDQAAWSSFRPGRTDDMFLHHVFPLVQAWARIDEEVAGELLETAVQEFAAAEEPLQRVNLSEETAERGIPLPLFAQAASLLAEQVTDATRIAQLIPDLETCTRRILAAVDPDATGRPQWLRHEDAWIPETYAPDTCSAALAAMLIGEIDALAGLARDHAPDTDLSPLLAARNRLVEQSMHWFRLEAGNQFEDRFQTGEHLPQNTLSGVLYPLYRDLDQTTAEHLATEIGQEGELRDAAGLYLWEPSDRDPEPPPISPSHHQVILHAFDRPDTRHARQELRECVGRSLMLRMSETGHLPIDLRTGRATPTNLDDPLWYESPAMSACLALAAVDPGVEVDDDELPEWLVKLDRHRVPVFGTAAAILAITIILSALHVARPTARAPAKKRTAAPAERMYTQLVNKEQYDEALVLLDDMADVLPDEQLALLRANIHFRKGEFDEAALHYRELTEAGSVTEKATLNLALTLFKQGRIDESHQLYQESAERFRDDHPEISEQAEYASTLIRRHRHTLIRKGATNDKDSDQQGSESE